MATHYSIFAWEIPWTRGAWQATVHRITESQTQLKQLSTPQACSLPPSSVQLFIPMTRNYPGCISNALKRNNILVFPGGKWIKIQKIHLLMQGTQVQSLVREDSTCSEQLSLCPMC